MIDKKLFENILLEYNKQDMKARFGNDLTNRFWELRNRLPGNLPEKDLNWWFTNNKSSDDLNVFLTDWETGNRRSNSQIHRDNLAGAEMLYDDEYIRIYKVTTYDAAKVLGRGTTWCICGLYPGHESRGQHYFDQYIENYGIKPFYIMVFDKKHSPAYRSDVNGNSADYEKWCVLFGNRGSAYSRNFSPVWRSDDRNFSQIQGIPANHQAQPIPGLRIPYDDTPAVEEPRPELVSVEEPATPAEEPVAEPAPAVVRQRRCSSCNARKPENELHQLARHMWLCDDCFAMTTEEEREHINDMDWDDLVDLIDERKASGWTAPVHTEPEVHEEPAAHQEEQPTIDANDFRAAFNMAMRNRRGAH